MLTPSMGPDGVRVSFVGIPRLTYTVQWAPALTGPWTTIAPVTVGASGVGNYMDPNQRAGKVFYRTTYP